MNKLTIKNNLKRYFDGTSTIEEEKQLKAYFSSGDIAPELASYSSLFVFFVEERQETLRDDFNLSKKATLLPIGKRTSVWKWSLAAAITLLFASWFIIDTPKETEGIAQQIDWSKYEPEDNEQAIRVALAAFKKTSVAMKRGTQLATQEVLEVGQIVKTVLQ